MNEVGPHSSKQPNVDDKSEGEEDQGDEDTLSKQEPLVKSYTEAMNSLEAVFHFLEHKGYTSKATTTFRLMDRLAVLQCEAGCQSNITDYYAAI